jgi:hypothetical protein
MVTSGIIATGSIPILDIDGPVYTDLRLPFYLIGTIITYIGIQIQRRQRVPEPAI